MKATVFLLLVLCAFTSWGQEDSPRPAPDTAALQWQDSLVMEEAEFERVYRRLEQLDRDGKLWTRERKSDNRFVRALDAIFRPEVVRVGNTAFSCSIYTAIKRKNPLCLINPLVVSVSW
ncbi:MAG: hypothetical protein L0Y58_20790 [Verrucomicrobia subdivision 3 bacterium]|nr:hypothetical protein [Limisphaerales bacterium]